MRGILSERKRDGERIYSNDDGYVPRIRELDSVPKSRRTAINPFFVKGIRGVRARKVWLAAWLARTGWQPVSYNIAHPSIYLLLCLLLSQTISLISLSFRVVLDYGGNPLRNTVLRLNTPQKRSWGNHWDFLKFHRFKFGSFNDLWEIQMIRIILSEPSIGYLR